MESRTKGLPGQKKSTTSLRPPPLQDIFEDLIVRLLKDDTVSGQEALLITTERTFKISRHGNPNSSPREGEDSTTEHDNQNRAGPKCPPHYVDYTTSHVARKAVSETAKKLLQYPKPDEEVLAHRRRVAEKLQMSSKVHHIPSSYARRHQHMSELLTGKSTQAKSNRNTGKALKRRIQIFRAKLNEEMTDWDLSDEFDDEEDDEHREGEECQDDGELNDSYTDERLASSLLPADKDSAIHHTHHTGGLQTRGIGEGSNDGQLEDSDTQMNMTEVGNIFVTDENAKLSTEVPATHPMKSDQEHITEDFHQDELLVNDAGIGESIGVFRNILTESDNNENSFANISKCSDTSGRLGPMDDMNTGPGAFVTNIGGIKKHTSQLNTFCANHLPTGTGAGVFRTQVPTLQRERANPGVSTSQEGSDTQPTLSLHNTDDRGFLFDHWDNNESTNSSSNESSKLRSETGFSSNNTRSNESPDKAFDQWGNNRNNNPSNEASILRSDAGFSSNNTGSNEWPDKAFGMFEHETDSKMMDISEIDFQEGVKINNTVDGAGNTYHMSNIANQTMTGEEDREKSETEFTVGNDNGVSVPAVNEQEDGHSMETNEQNDTLKGSSEIGEEEIHSILETLMRAQRNFKNVIPSIKQDEFQQKLAIFMERKKATAAGSTVTVTEEEAFRVKNLEQMIKYFEKKIEEIVKFAKCIPGFRGLSIDDQANLIKVSRTESGLVGGFPGVNTRENVVYTEDSGRMSISNLGKIVSPEYMQGFMAISRKIEDARITEKEAAVLRGITLTFTDRCQLKEPDKVQIIQNKLVTCLRYVLARDCTEVSPTVRLGQLFNILTCLRNFTDVDSTMLRETLNNYPNFTCNDLVSEFLGGTQS